MATVAGVKPHPIYLAGSWVDSPDVLEIENPARPGELAGATYLATEAQYEQAVEAAVKAFEVTRVHARLRARPDPARGQRRHQGPARGAGRAHRGRGRQADPRRAGRGRPRDAHVPARGGGGRAPVRRGHPARPHGDLEGPGRASRAASRSARSPGISPFNFPLNLAAHKVAPAIASGNPIVLKPPSKDPLVMLAIAEIIDAAGIPEGAVEHPADEPRAGRPDGERRAVQAAHVHRLARRSAGG